MLPKDIKTINIILFVLVCMKIMHTKTGHCIFNHMKQLSNCAATDLFYKFKNLEKFSNTGFTHMYFVNVRVQEGNRSFTEMTP